MVSKVLYDLGSEYVEGVNAISGERCSPHPHVFTDRMLRPGDPAYYDILHLHGLSHLLLPHVRHRVARRRRMVDAYKRCRDYLDAAINADQPGVTTAEIVSALAEGAGVRLPE